MDTCVRNSEKRIIFNVGISEPGSVKKEMLSKAGNDRSWESQRQVSEMKIFILDAKSRVATIKPQI